MPFGNEYSEPCGDTFAMRGRAPSGSNGVGVSPSSSSSSDDESDTDVTSWRSIVDASESEDDSEAVDGSYSCLRGDEDRRFLFDADFGDPRFGVIDPFSWIGLGDRWTGGEGGSSRAGKGSLSCLSERLFRSFAGLRALGLFALGMTGHSGSSFGEHKGVVGGLAFRILGMLGSSKEGTDERRR